MTAGRSRRVLAAALGIAAALVVSWLVGCSSRSPASEPAGFGLDGSAAVLVAPRAALPAFQMGTDGVVTSDARRPMKVRVTQEGAEITRDRVSSSVKLHVASVGRAEPPTVLARDRSPEILGARVELPRAGVAEWYALDTKGVEQGFRVEERPSGKGPLVLRVAVEGFVVSASQVEGELDLRAETADAPSFRYGALAATDEGGVALVATMRAESAHVIRLEVEDTAAQYPITIDPLVWGLQTRLVALQSTADDLLGGGTGVAVAGDLILAGKAIGADGSGGVIVFRHGASGWSQEAEISAPFLGSWLFGSSLAIAPDAIFGVGAGTAYAYRRTNSAWTLMQGLPTNQPSPPYGDWYTPFAYSGGTAALLNRTVASQAGAPDGGIPGSADVYEADAGIWGIAATIQTVDPISIGPAVVSGVPILPGGGLALEGDRVVIGTGISTLIYRRSPSGAYALEARIAAPNPSQTPAFGASVALSGSTLLIGNPQERSAYFYVLASSGWTLQQEVLGIPLPATGAFGGAVALVGDTAWITDPIHATGKGALYRYRRTGQEWSLDEQIDSPGTDRGAFGISIAADETNAVVSAPGEANNAGAVYVYELANALGDTCAMPQDCISGFCVQGLCCDSACDDGNPQSCSTCKGRTPGTCSPAEKGASCRPPATSCDVAELCDGVSRKCPLDAILANGTPCENGYCVGGACIPSADEKPPSLPAVSVPQLDAGGGGCSASAVEGSSGSNSLPLLSVAGVVIAILLRGRPARAARGRRQHSCSRHH